MNKLLSFLFALHIYFLHQVFLKFFYSNLLEAFGFAKLLCLLIFLNFFENISNILIIFLFIFILLILLIQIFLVFKKQFVKREKSVFLFRYNAFIVVFILIPDLFIFIIFIIKAHFNFLNIYNLSIKAFCILII